MASLAAAAVVPGCLLLDSSADPDHNRLVLSLAAASAEALAEGLFAAVAQAVERIDLRRHSGVHPRLGVADVVPLVPLGTASMEECVAAARSLGTRIWSELRVPVFFYGAGAGRLADVRAGRVEPDLGAGSHQRAGAVCVGARPPLVALNVLLGGMDIEEARGLARRIRESGGGLGGVQALAFALPDGRVQLSMNLVDVAAAPPGMVLAELKKLGVEIAGHEVVGLCPALAAAPAAAGRLLETRLAAAAARAGAAGCRRLGGDELERLAFKLEAEADALARMGTGQDELLAGSERAAALVRVLRAGGAGDPSLEALLMVAAAGLRAAVTPRTAARYRARVMILDRWLSAEETQVSPAGPPS